MNRVKTISAHWNVTLLCYEVAIELANGNHVCRRYKTDNMQNLIDFILHEIHKLETMN